MVLMLMHWCISVLLIATIPTAFSLPQSGELRAATCDSHKHRLKNSAFVFIKPHANTQATQELVVDKLTKAGIQIVKEFCIDSKEIERNGYIDRHYYSIASKATILPPEEIAVPDQQFEDAFGESWSQVLEEHRACNAVEACERWKISPAELSQAWSKARIVKFGGGFYCGKLTMKGKPELYVFNAFFLAMRESFLGGNSIQCYVIEWDPSTLPWSSFRREILGNTDPSKAPRGSIRREILEKHRVLGLLSSPSISHNGVHASASPFEGLAEKTNWLGSDVEDDNFGKALLGEGISRSKILSWFKDPQVQVGLHCHGSVFDALEDLDADECLEKVRELHELNGSAAFDASS